MIFHGKTLTSKVSLRSVCRVISKYGFVASPYPIAISAEVHCGLAGQDMIAQIMIEEFGDSLVRVPADSDGHRDKIEQLPSPEVLKGKILLKVRHVPFAFISLSSLYLLHRPKISTSSKCTPWIVTVVVHSRIPPLPHPIQMRSPISQSIIHYLPIVTTT